MTFMRNNAKAIRDICIEKMTGKGSMKTQAGILAEAFSHKPALGRSIEIIQLMQSLINNAPNYSDLQYMRWAFAYKHDHGDPLMELYGIFMLMMFCVFPPTTDFAVEYANVKEYPALAGKSHPITRDSAHVGDLTVACLPSGYTTKWPLDATWMDNPELPLAFAFYTNKTAVGAAAELYALCRLAYLELLVEMLSVLKARLDTVTTQQNKLISLMSTAFLTLVTFVLHMMRPDGANKANG